MDDGRNFKSNGTSQTIGNQTEPEETWREIREKIETAKERWMKDCSQEMKNLQGNSDSFGMHKRVKDILNQYRKKQTIRLKKEKNEFI